MILSHGLRILMMRMKCLFRQMWIGNYSWYPDVAAMQEGWDSITLIRKRNSNNKTGFKIIQNIHIMRNAWKCILLNLLFMCSSLPNYLIYPKYSSFWWYTAKRNSLYFIFLGKSFPFCYNTKTCDKQKIIIGYTLNGSYEDSNVLVSLSKRNYHVKKYCPWNAITLN